MKQLFPILIFILFFNITCKKDEVKLPTITTTIVSDIKPTSAKSGGLVIQDGGGVVSDKGVCWSKNQNPTIQDNHTSDGVGKDVFSSILNNLEENTTYYVRSFATNSAGTGYGNSFTFQTTKSFSLNGQWVWHNNDMWYGMTGVVDMNTKQCIVTYVQSNAYHFKVGDIWWKDITKVSDTQYKYQQLIRYTDANESYFYTPATINVVDENNLLLILDENIATTTGPTMKFGRKVSK